MTARDTALRVAVEAQGSLSPWTKDFSRASRIATTPGPGWLVIDTKAVAAETKLDGKYLLSTFDQHLSPAEVAVGCNNLLKAERGFRDMKTGLRPVFHRLEPRIRTHVLICCLALLLTRVAECTPARRGPRSAPTCPDWPRSP